MDEPVTRASKELKLIAKIVDAGDIHTVMDAGITIDKFRSHDCQLMYKYIHDYWRNKKTQGNIPTRDLLEEKFPTVTLPEPDRLTVSAVVEEFQAWDIRARLGELSVHISDHDGSPDQILHHLEREVREMQTIRRTSRDIVVSESTELARSMYETNKTRGTLSGLPYPWKILNDETQGMQDGEYIIFYGRPKSLKTWVALNTCIHAYDAAAARTLIYTREMSPEQMLIRSICLIIGAPYDDWKHGRLREVPHPHGGTMEDAYYAILDHLYQDERTCSLEMGRNKSLIITSDREDRKHGGGVLGLRRKVEDHKPDLVYVDAVYLMRNDREQGKRSVKWNDQSAISQDLKDLAQDMKRPLIATLQANRDSELNQGRSSANMAYSDSYAQDCDLGIEIIKKRIDRTHNELALSITASREVNIAGFAIHGNPASNFGQLYRQVSDSCGLKTSEDGQPIVQPVIFNDHSDIKKIFWSGVLPENQDEPAYQGDRGRVSDAELKAHLNINNPITKNSNKRRKEKRNGVSA